MKQTNKSKDEHLYHKLAADFAPIRNVEMVWIWIDWVWIDCSGCTLYTKYTQYTTGHYCIA